MRISRAALQAAVMLNVLVAGCGTDADPDDPLVSQAEQEGVIWDCAVDADCNDSNACTQDHCNPSLGICQNYAIGGCCTSDAACNDGNACTTDTCSNNACTHAPITGGTCGPPPQPKTPHFTQDPDKVTFTNDDGAWTIYKRCIGPSLRTDRKTVGPGYIAKLTVGSKVIVNDEDYLCKDGSAPPCTGAKAGPNWGWGGLGSFGWHHARGAGGDTAKLDANNAWDVSSRFCAADTGVGVTSASVINGPFIDSSGVGQFDMDVWFGDMWTSQLLRVRYRYRIYNSVVKMWALATEHCPDGNCGNAPRAYIKEPKFVAESVLGGGAYTNITTFNKDSGVVYTYNAGATNPSKIGNGQSDNIDRTRVRFDYGSSVSCNNTDHPCLNVVMRSITSPSADDISPSGSSSLWQTSTGLDGWAVASKDRATFNATDTITPSGGLCSGGGAGSNTAHPAVRRWEYGGWKPTGKATETYTRVGVAFHGWEGGSSAYECSALSKAFGPEGERWAVHGEFSIAGGWSVQ